MARLAPGSASFKVNSSRFDFANQAGTWGLFVIPVAILAYLLAARFRRRGTKGKG